MNQPSAEPTILVIEDDDAARAGLASLLKPFGYQVATVPDCKAALDLLAQPLNPTLILLDMILPVMDGWQFIAQRRKNPGLAAIPVVIMTGLSIASKEWALAMGASDLLRKPIEVSSLLETVRHHSRQAV